MAKTKPRGTDDEICVLISLRRERAWDAMSRIVHGLARIRHEEPTVSTLLEYLSNMASTLELMLKLLSGNWGNHEAGAMYETVFGHPHADPDFMACLKFALTDQKYLFAPASDPSRPGAKTIAHYIPEMEALFDSLRAKMWEQHRTHCVVKEFDLPISFGEFLRDNVGRFFKGKTYRGPLTPEMMQQAREQFLQQLQSAAATIDLYLEMRKGVGVAEGTGASIEGLR
jgi:hypothetical protein